MDGLSILSVCVGVCLQVVVVLSLVWLPAALSLANALLFCSVGSRSFCRPSPLKCAFWAFPLLYVLLRLLAPFRLLVAKLLSLVVLSLK